MKIGKESANDLSLLKTRRAFLKTSLGFGLGAMTLGWLDDAGLPLLGKAKASQTNVTPKGTAKNCLFIMLRGGASHVDTFDLKVGKWTPKKLEPTKLPAGYLWPVGLMPKLAQKADKFSIVRSLQHVEVVHERAQYFLETGRRLNPGLRLEIPNIGSVVALERAATRKATDIFPSFVSFDPFSFYVTNNGFLPVDTSPLRFTDSTTGIANLAPKDGMSAFERRRSTFKFLEDIEIDSLSQPISVIQDQAEKLLKDPITKTAFVTSNDDFARYGNNLLGGSLAVAKNLFKANRGTHFIEVSHFNWDHHSRIYSSGALDVKCKELDIALSALIDDLTASPGQNGGKTLLDETLIVVMGEFGRTVGPLNRTKGRDHYPYAFSAMFLGGGVQGGRIVGATDELGAGVTDFGWSHTRAVHLSDIATTVFSALGIDWTKVLSNTPSGRPFRYVDPEAIGDLESHEISALF